MPHSIALRPLRHGLLMLGASLLAPAPLLAYDEPRFDLVAHFDAFELRHYSPFVIAEVEVRGDFEGAGMKRSEFSSTTSRAATGANWTWR